MKLSEEEKKYASALYGKIFNNSYKSGKGNLNTLDEVSDKALHLVKARLDSYKNTYRKSGKIIDDEDKIEIFREIRFIVKCECSEPFRIGRGFIRPSFSKEVEGHLMKVISFAETELEFIVREIEMDKNNEKKLDSSHLFLALGGAMAGAWWIKKEIAEGKKSRSEKDYPEDVAEVCEEIGELLDDWSPTDCENEDEYTMNLFNYLADNCDWEIEMYANTSEGKPDILIENLLALELKVNPNKGERDRLIGQCAGYSRQWVTWAVIIDSSASQIGKIENLLADKGLEHILVLSYN